MSKTPETHCPVCHQVLPMKLGRICSECHLPIGKGHKYEFCACSVRHKNCSDPTMSGNPSAPQPRLIEEKP
jgi:hypothetical protein